MIYQNLVVDIFCPKSFFIILNRVTFIHLQMSELSIVTDSDLFIGSSPLQYPSTPDNTSTITNHGSSADFEEIQNNISQQLSTHSAQKYWREVFFKVAPECGLNMLL